MKILVKNCTIIDSRSPYNGQSLDILIHDGQITEIGKDLESAANKVIEEDGLHLSPGWVELHSNFSDPGFEEREDLRSGSEAAAAGGFTSVVLMPSVDPPVDSRADIDYVYNRSEEFPVNLYPVGALSKGLKGEELSEMFDMRESGAIAFSDDTHPVSNPNLLKLGLLYSSNLDTPVLSRPFQSEIAGNGQMNEGHTSTYLGLRGIPALAEELMIARDLYLAEYTGGRIHFCGVSTLRGIDMIREAKEKGVRASCDVNLYNLVHDESVLSDYNTYFKVNPPLRERETISGLIENLQTGVVDAIAIDHIPMDEERKNCEFEHASFGMAGLETAYGKYQTYLSDKIGLELFVDLISHGPRDVLDLPRITVKEGSMAELTLFCPTGETLVESSRKRSRSVNDPTYGQTLKGKVVGIINKSGFTRS